MPSVLFVCTANICRSPLALGLFKRKLSGTANEAIWKVDSAGTWTVDGEPASEKSLVLLQKQGVDLRGHRSKTVSKELLGSFNLILTMERGHKEALQAEFPEVKKRVFLLSEMIGERYDIPDPFGGPLEEYQETMEEIEGILDKGFEKICALAQDQAAETV